MLTLWLLSMGWLIRYEAFPHWFDSTVQGYREMSRHLPALRDSWMKILSEGEHVGYVNNSIEMTEVEGEEQLQMNTQILLRIRYGGGLELVRLSNEVQLDARQNLMGSFSTFSLAAMSGSLRLEPVEETRTFEMTVTFNQMQFSRSITLPPGAVISSPLMDTGLRAVKVGKTIRIRSFDPFSPSGELRTMEVTGVSRERRRFPGQEQEVEVTQVRIRFGDWDLKAEVDEFGRIVYQETPFGLTFVQSDASVAMKIPQNQAFDPVRLLSGQNLPSLINFPENL